MATIDGLRGALNGYLKRTDGDSLPWSDADCNTYLGDAIGQLWPVYGLFTSGDVASSSASQEYALPGSIPVAGLSRIALVDSAGRYVDRVSKWRARDATHVIVFPAIRDGYTLRCFGWKAFALTGSDLPTSLEDAVVYAAASLAYGALAASLVNWQRQQNLDSGRMVSYQEAAAMSAYWASRSTAALHGSEHTIGFASRSARR